MVVKAANKFSFASVFPKLCVLTGTAPPVQVSCLHLHCPQAQVCGEIGSGKWSRCNCPDSGARSVCCWGSNDFPGLATSDQFYDTASLGIEEDEQCTISLFLESLAKR